MKLLYYNDFILGAVKGDTVVDLTDVVKNLKRSDPHSLIKNLITDFDAYREDILKKIDSVDGIPLKQVSIRPPLPKPSNIVCMAVNYNDGTLPTKPPLNAFQKSPSSIVGQGDTMILPDIPATIFEGEAELAVVIGRYASKVKAADAMDYVFGYVNFIDGSARGVGTPSNMFYPVKSRDTFAPIGPYLVTADEVPDPHNLNVKLRNNGDVMQDFTTADMANRIPECIEWITSIHALEPGDILATGTNHGGLHPFQGGDRIELEVEGLGMLSITVRDDLKRTWKKETRRQRQDQGMAGTTPQITGKYV